MKQKIFSCPCEQQWKTTDGQHVIQLTGYQLHEVEVRVSLCYVQKRLHILRAWIRELAGPTSIAKGSVEFKQKTRAPSPSKLFLNGLFRDRRPSICPCNIATFDTLWLIEFVILSFFTLLGGVTKVTQFLEWSVFIVALIVFDTLKKLMINTSIKNP